MTSSHSAGCNLIPLRAFGESGICERDGMSSTGPCRNLQYGYGRSFPVQHQRRNQLLYDAISLPKSPDGETGRRTGLKIPGGESSVTVQFRLRAPVFSSEVLFAILATELSPQSLRRSRGRPYSQRSAIIGSTLEARRAGIAQANPDTTPSRIIPANRMTGSRRSPCAHFVMT